MKCLKSKTLLVFFWPNFATISWANNLKHVWCLLQNELKMCTKTNSNESSNSCFSLKDKLKEKNEICSTHWQFFQCFKHVPFISPSWVCLLKKNNDSYYSCFSPKDKLGEKNMFEALTILSMLSLPSLPLPAILWASKQQRKGKTQSSCRHNWNLKTQLLLNNQQRHHQLM